MSCVSGHVAVQVYGSAFQNSPPLFLESSHALHAGVSKSVFQYGVSILCSEHVSHTVVIIDDTDVGHV